MLLFMWMSPVCVKAATHQEVIESPQITNHVRTQNEMTIRGQHIAYNATVGSIILRDSTDQPIANLYYTEYKRRDIQDLSHRPILFAYNGGPIVASVYLHIGVLGPRRIVTDAHGKILPPYELVDNDYSLLDRADLVFIDPVGTGFSKPAGSASGQDFWGIEEDARSLAQFISRYLKETGRSLSPLYLIGESYGTIRSAVLVRHLQNEQHIPVTGVILVSSALDGNVVWTSSGHLEPYILRLPSYAAAAWYHHRLPDRPEALLPFLKEVEQFTVTEFVSALFQWPDMPDEKRTHVLNQLYKYTGLSKEYWEKSNLRVGLQDFVKELLRDQNLVLLRSDTRETFPATEERRRKKNPFETEFKAYLRKELGINESDNYVVVKSISTWNWLSYKGRPNTYGRPNVPVFQNYLDDLAEAMKKNPHLHISLHSGIYDLTCAYFPAEWSMARMDIPEEMRSRVEMAHYEGGHMVYLVPSEHVTFTQNLVRFIDSTSKSSCLPNPH